MQVIASTSAMINFCMSSSPELVHTRYTTCEADRSALGDDPDRMRPIRRLRSVFRDKIMLDRRPDVPDYDPAERILNHVPHDLLRFNLYRRRAALRHHRIRGRPTTTEAGRLDGKGLPLPYRRGPARAEAALCDNRRADRRAG